MAEAQEMPKAYEPAGYESGISQAWEESGFFNPDKLPDRFKSGEPFTVVLPPPNVTGVLHVGHATMLALQDLMIRFRRMQGRRALWVPGTDHAAIATQVKVESLLREKGMKDPRKELGREKLLAEITKFAAESHETIVNQVKKMGSSIDWSREAYTLDETRSGAVNRVFKMMFDDGIIEQGYRIVNWDPQFQTTLSDDEVLSKETTARLLTFTYDADFPIAISTTRPETKFGDTAVAVHPDDKRYVQFVGKEFSPVFCGKQLKITVIADAAVDPTFGTGALGVTPAHSQIDADMAERHNLPTVQVIGQDARMLPEVGVSYAGLSVKEARVKIEADLAALGLLKKAEETPQNLPIAERGGAAVEQLPMKQWFVRVNKPFALRQDTLGKWKKGEQVTLKMLMNEAVASSKVAIVPDRFQKVYFHWIENLRDWCISRQIWFGHRIPVWHKGDELYCGETTPEGDGWQQDPDTLDTWFSSGLWTFSVFGWPEQTSDLKTFHPTDVLETGYDILFFWVARMVLMSTYVLGEIPFKNVYLHGLVRDEKGRKLSKSLGNAIDPLEVSAKYGTDAVRLSLVVGTAPGQDTRVWDEKIAGFRNFANKLWNIGRYVSKSRNLEISKPHSIADRWILSRLNNVIAEVTSNLEKYNFSAAGEALREFTWGDLADWYVEIHKREGNDAVLGQVFNAVLRLWHPYMPFVTEAIHTELGGKELLMVAEWPAASDAPDAEAESVMLALQQAVNAIRSLRSDYKVTPEKKLDAVIGAGEFAKHLESFSETITTLGRLEKLSIVVASDAASDSASVAVGSLTVSIPLAGMIDPEKEKTRIKDAIVETERLITAIKTKLENADFVSRAPEKVVSGEKTKLAEAQARLIRLKEQFEVLS